MKNKFYFMACIFAAVGLAIFMSACTKDEPAISDDEYGYDSCYLVDLDDLKGSWELIEFIPGPDKPNEPSEKLSGTLTFKDFSYDDSMDTYDFYKGNIMMSNFPDLLDGSSVTATVWGDKYYLPQWRGHVGSINVVLEYKVDDVVNMEIITGWPRYLNQTDMQHGVMTVSGAWGIAKETQSLIPKPGDIKLKKL